MAKKRMLLKRVRLARGMTQRALSEAVGCNPNSITRIENNLEPPYPKRGAKIADALGWHGDVEMLYSVELTEEEVEEALRVLFTFEASDVKAR